MATIRTAYGDGIIDYAKNARDEYKRISEEENEMIEEYEDCIKENLYLDHITEDGVPIPKGFYVVGGTKDNGLVISDIEGDDLANSKKGNQFVWIPTTTDIIAYGLNTSNHREPDVVTNVSPSDTVDSSSGDKFDAVESNLEIVLEGEYAATKTAASFKAQLTSEFNKMASSVNKYRGFYVGRYEMSLDTSGNAQSVKGAVSATSMWYGLYAKAKTYTNVANSVTSSMIYGSQYKAMMKWMGNAANSTIGDNRNRSGRTGTCETDIINNVYDLYGNSMEWTQEACKTYGRNIRGGFTHYAYAPSYEVASEPTKSVWFRF